MPRSVYHQSAGNPVQLDRLPASKPELHFAAKALSFSEQTMTIGKCWGLLLLGTACVWSMQPDGVFRSELGLMAVVLFLGASFLMRVAWFAVSGNRTYSRPAEFAGLHHHCRSGSGWTHG